MNRQLSLFPNIVRRIDLRSNSPRKAWWRLMIQECRGKYTLIKESGIQSGMLDRRRWPMKSYDKALIIFEKKVKMKTDPNRKTRIYKVAA
jgi:hypothetical protein